MYCIEWNHCTMQCLLFTWHGICTFQFPAVPSALTLRPHSNTREPNSNCIFTYLILTCVHYSCAGEANFPSIQIYPIFSRDSFYFQESFCTPWWHIWALKSYLFIGATEKSTILSALGQPFTKVSLNKSFVIKCLLHPSLLENLSFLSLPHCEREYLSSASVFMEA